MKLTQRNQMPLTREANALLGSVLADELAAVSLSVYDTARVVTLTPGLTGQRGRIQFLLSQQTTEGSWGAADGYALVPTLSATEALLGLVTEESDLRPRILDAVRGGLTALQRWLRPGSAYCTPDTIAVEFLVPALVQDLNARLSALSPQAPIRAELREPLGLPSDLDSVALDTVRASTAAGVPLSPKLWASLEAFGSAATAQVSASGGAVAASPSATAALLAANGSGDHAASRRFLEDLQARGGGAVPGVIPITYFEQAWTLNSFALAGLGHTAPRAMLDNLEAGISEYGVPAAPGLPADADDTAATLYALGLHGRPRRPDSLMDYRADGYFRCFSSERTPSISTNAHVLEALGSHVSLRPADAGRYADSIAIVTTWLLDNQWSDGSWLDKWHASAYYATACCVLALTGYAPAHSSEAVARAVDWVLSTQRPDGSWGRWSGTMEETSYAVWILMRARRGSRAREVERAVRAAASFLLSDELLAADDASACPGLWHSKDLYAPVRVIRAARLSAVSMATRLVGSELTRTG